MAAMDQGTMYLLFVTLVGLVLFFLMVVNRFSSSDSNKKPKERRQQQVPGNREDNVPPAARRRGPRRRMRMTRDDSEDEGSEDDIDDIIAQHDGKIGTKKLRKLQEKQEKKQMRQQELEEREEKKQREAKLEALRKKEEEKRKAEEAIREEEERLKREEQEKQEQEEYLKLKEAFSVEEEGEGDEEADLSSESLLKEFIDYIKEMKVVMLEDLAAHFKLKTQDVIQRVQDLQAEGQLTGVVDDRGKFIYITMEELEAVAKYIRQCGRISISDLAASSNQLINLNPDNSETRKRLLTEVVG